MELAGSGGSEAVELAGDETTEETGPEISTTDPCPTSSTTITPKTTTLKVSGSDVQAAVDDAVTKQNGHVASVFPKFARHKFCVGKGKTVLSAIVSVDEIKTVPSWKERSQYPKLAQDMWDRYVAKVNEHEDKHVAIDTKAFTDMHKKVIGLTVDKAKAALQAVISKADTENAALDAKEGCIKLNGGSGAVTTHPVTDCQGTP